MMIICMCATGQESCHYSNMVFGKGINSLCQHNNTRWSTGTPHQHGEKMMHTDINEWDQHAGRRTKRGRSRERRSPYEAQTRYRSKDCRLCMSARNIRDSSGESDIEIDSMVIRGYGNLGKSKIVRSGMLDKPSSRAKLKLTWPQKQLKFMFVEEAVEFKDLNFDQFLAGEIKTIRTCEDKFERNNRLRILE